MALPFHPQPKGPTRAAKAAQKARHADRVIHLSRGVCVERDGFCRVGKLTGGCRGGSQWAHLSGYRRSQTRKMAPEYRHDPRHCLMLCAFHHQAEDEGVLKIMFQTDRGADGPIRVEWREA